MSGYQIKRFVELALSHFWSESYGQLFPTLNRFVDEGLATRKREISAGGRRRNTYTITPRGEEQFRAWLKEPPEQMAVRNEALLKFFLASKLSDRERIDLVSRYRDQQQALYQLYRDSEIIYLEALESGNPPDELTGLLDEMGGAADQQKQLQMFYLTLRHGVLHTRARLDWCDETLNVLKRP